MKAALLTKYGGSDAITVGDIPQPLVIKDKILAEVYAAGVNPSDWKIQNGLYKDFAPLSLPVTMGGDLAGIVNDVGPGVTKFKKGDEVYGQASVLGGATGTFAEFAQAIPDTIAYKPKKISFEEAGALPLVGISAVQAITEHINLQKGQKILIHGGAGGIGSIVIQIAKHIGAFIATTVSAGDMDYVKNLGADIVIDHKNQNFVNVVSGYDSVFDAVGGEITTKSISVLKNGGMLVSMVEQVPEELAKAKNISTLVQQTRVTTERLEKLTDFVDQGIVTVNVEKTFPLDKTAEALDYLKNTPPKGKVVIIIK